MENNSAVEKDKINRERSRLAAASSICDSTKHNGLVTMYLFVPEISRKARPVAKHDGSVGQRGRGAGVEVAIDDNKLCGRVQDVA